MYVIHSHSVFSCRAIKFIVVKSLVLINKLKVQFRVLIRRRFTQDDFLYVDSWVPLATIIGIAQLHILSILPDVETHIGDPTCVLALPPFFVNTTCAEDPHHTNKNVVLDYFAPIYKFVHLQIYGAASNNEFRRHSEQLEESASIVRAAILSTRSIATRSDFFCFCRYFASCVVIPPFCGFRGIPASTCDDRGVSMPTQRSGQQHHLRHHTSIEKLMLICNSVRHLGRRNSNSR